jgi:Ca2+/Na+ antiporter
MNDKNKKILNIQKKVRNLRAEVKKTKEKVPVYIIGFAVFMICTVYYLEDKVYTYFGGAINFIKCSILLFVIVVLFFLYKTYLSIQKKENEIKRFNNELFKLMKL